MYLLGMNINEYINSSDNKAEARRILAANLGIKEVTVRSWANGNRHPNRRIWAAIVSATNGAVTITDLMDDGQLIETVKPSINYLSMQRRAMDHHS